MNINTRIYLNSNDHSNIKATANITLDDCFAVKGIKVMEGNGKLFISMPSRKIGDGYKEDCFPVTKEFRDQLNTAVMDSYKEKLENTQKQASQLSDQENHDDQSDQPDNESQNNQNLNISM